MADRPAEAIERHRPAPSPSRVDAPGHVTAGDIVVVGSRDGDSPRRMVIALDVDEARRCFLGALVTAELAMATADDVILHTADTGLQYSIVAMTQLAGHLWFAQAEARIGRLTEEALAAVRAGHAWAENEFQHGRRGVPLQDASRDLRWPDLEAEVRQIEELTMHCTLRRRESDWAGPDKTLAQYIRKETEATLAAYGSQPNLAIRDANDEQDTAHGGYQHRQLFELVQNSADALSPDADASKMGDDAPRHGRGRIEVRLTTGYLYCADNGNPIGEPGVRALMFSRLSPKRGTSQIGTFGLGFRAVLGVSDSPEFFSLSGSLRFDRKRSRERIREVVPNADRCPVLSLPEPIDPSESQEQDSVLRELMDWAANIVRLPLKSDARDDIRRQMIDFPAEFLLFVPHVGRLTITDGSEELNRVLELERVGSEFLLADGDGTSQWRLFERSHRLSGDARADRRPGDDQDQVPVWWAAPVDRLDRPGKFWAFFPTTTWSLVPGIFNASWKTNEDRQNLLPGRYNDELIEASAELIAEKLSMIPTAEDPARHLDALPRRHEAGDSHQADLLRECLFTALHGRAIVPDQNGKLRRIRDISYPPSQLTPDRGMDLAPFERWAAHLSRPSDWLHHKGLTRTRLATVDRLFQTPDQPGWRVSRAPRASIAEWLEALIQNAAPGEEVAASSAAIQTAALIPRDRRTDVDLGRIVLTESGRWRAPDPQRLFLPFESEAAGGSTEPDSSVHPALAADPETLSALKQLGLETPSPESRFKAIANRVLANQGHLSATSNHSDEFWKASRGVSAAVGLAIVQEHQDWRRRLQLRTLAGSWQPIHSVLMPGDVVPGDGSRDDDVTVDTNFHERDNDLLRRLGVSDGPQADRDLRWEPSYDHYRGKCEVCYRRQPLRKNPQRRYLEFKLTTGVGPLDVLTALSDEGRVRYTCAVLGMDACYEPWEMWHSTQSEPSPELYPEKQFESLTLRMVRKHGSVQTPGGTVPFASALGSHPDTPAALHALLRHPNAEKIKQAFELSEPIPEFIREGAPVPLTDEWPGLKSRLLLQQRECRLIRCERISVLGREEDCLAHDGDVYLANTHLADPTAINECELRLVASALSLDLTDDDIRQVLAYVMPAEIKQRRAAIRDCPTDAERLLAAVGVDVLRSDLPRSLLEFIKADGGRASDIEIAKAAISSHGTGALRKYRNDLGHLDPPSRWAGSTPAREFVQSLGFPEEWAGEPGTRRDPFEEVEGPRSLPDLHCYQRTIVDNLRQMIRAQLAQVGERRGMISMPTGSGKTRVAVEAIVAAMRDGQLDGPILWVAHRDELCEQAVEAWRQVWASIGPEAARLRVSRLWGSQSPPLAAAAPHVIVATIQTLRSRIQRVQGEESHFLADIQLVVFDEAHHSIAPSYTAVMDATGLTRFGRPEEPLLLGLSATPHRGYDEDESARLAARYGRNRLDAGAFERDDPQFVVAELQRENFLALAHHEIIEGGTFTWSDHELDRTMRFVRTAGESDTDHLRRLLAWLPPELEHRIAGDTERTRRIVDRCTSLDPDWPVLIFATSVEHARTVAILLDMNGLTARAVTSETEAVDRRRAVEEFRSGDIRALVNYGVLTEGFDAPETRAIVVARPVYSPNLYFQMIGRGLRGPRNGGTEFCLIINVQDNFEQFGQSLAFSELDWLWAG